MITIQWSKWSFFALIALQVAWFGWLYPPTFWPKAMVLAIMLIPLLTVAIGVWKLNMRTMVVAGFFLLFYFSYAVSEAYAVPEVRPMALAQIALITVYFVALLSVRRAQKAAQKAQQQPPPQQPPQQS